MSAYFSSVSDYSDCSTLPSEWIDDVETRYAGWIDKQIELVSSLDIDARLAKRYNVPFGSPCPLAIQSWVARILDSRVLLRRGVDPQDDQYAMFFVDADRARAEIKEAADAELGLYDLPLLSSSGESGIVKGAPKSYSEASPYVFMARQSLRARSEDSNGEGTRRG